MNRLDQLWSSLRQTTIFCDGFFQTSQCPDTLPESLPAYIVTKGQGKRLSRFHVFKYIFFFSSATHETCRELFIHPLLPFLAPSLGGCGCYPCFVMCLTAHGLTAALLLTKEFPLESLCEDSAFLAFFLEKFLEYFINSVASTLLTTHVASHVRPQAFHGWLLSCCVPAQLHGATTAVPLVPQHDAGRAAPQPCDTLYLPREHGTSTDLWLPGCGSGRRGGAGVPRWPMAPVGKGGDRAVDAGLQHHVLPKRCLRCRERCPSARPLGSTKFLCSLKKCEVYRKKGQTSFLQTSSAILETLNTLKGKLL